jgi:hypothetical protein
MLTDSVLEDSCLGKAAGSRTACIKSKAPFKAFSAEPSISRKRGSLPELFSFSPAIKFRNSIAESPSSRNPNAALPVLVLSSIDAAAMA